MSFVASKVNDGLTSEEVGFEVYEYWGMWFDDGYTYDWVVDDDFGRQQLVLDVEGHIHQSQKY